MADDNPLEAVCEGKQHSIAVKERPAYNQRGSRHFQAAKPTSLGEFLAVFRHTKRQFLIPDGRFLVA